MTLHDSNSAKLAERTVCQVLALNRGTLRHALRQWFFNEPPIPKQRSTYQQTNALSAAERSHVLSVLNSDQFHDQPPAQVYYKLLSQGDYLCSVSTMHRLLRSADQQGDRREQRAP